MYFTRYQGAKCVYITTSLLILLDGSNKRETIRPLSAYVLNGNFIATFLIGTMRLRAMLHGGWHVEMSLGNLALELC